MDAESLIQNTITDVVYVLKLAAHLNPYSSIASIFPVIQYKLFIFKQRKRDFLNKTRAKSFKKRC